MINPRLIIQEFQRTLWSIFYQKSITKIIPQFKDGIGFADTTVNSNATELEVNINNLSHFVMRDLLPISGVSPYPITEQLLLASAVVKLKPKYIFEWGTHLGISARIFYEVCKKYGIDAIIHSVDLPDDIKHIEHPGKNRGIKVRGIKNVFLHQGDGLDKSLEIAQQFKDNTLLFFLDGDHEYKSVSRELNGIFNKFPYANMLIHDTFYQSFESNYNIGPFKAIQDFLKKHPNHYRKLSTNLGLPGMTLLYTNHE